MVPILEWVRVARMDDSTRIAAQQLGRMRGMTRYYHEQFFSDVRYSTLATAALLDSMASNWRSQRSARTGLAINITGPPLKPFPRLAFPTSNSISGTPIR